LTASTRARQIEASASMALDARAKALKASGQPIISFGVGEPDFPTPENIKQAAISAIGANFTKYTPTGGTLELKQAICERHRVDYGTNYSPAECMVTVGGKHAIFNLMQVLIGHGDEVVIPAPYWVTYKDVVNFAGGTCVFVPSDEAGGFTFTAENIAPHINGKTKLLIINSPNNPSGAVLSPQEFGRIYALASKHGVKVLTDECYCRFLYEGEPFSIASMPGAKDDVVVAGSLSKTYSMTGWRIGFALAPKPLIDAMMKLQSHTTSNPASVSQKAAIEALRGPQESIGIMLAEYRKRRDYVVSRLRAIPGVGIAEPKGAFYAYPNISVGFRNGISSPVQFAERLLSEAHVAVVPGEAFGTSEHVRISYATSMTELERGLDRIEHFILGR